MIYKVASLRLCFAKPSAHLEYWGLFQFKRQRQGQRQDFVSVSVSGFVSNQFQLFCNLSLSLSQKNLSQFAICPVPISIR